MKLESKYNFKDTVFPVIQGNKHEFVSCTFCGGEGNIVGKDQKSRVCPKCWGRGGNNTWIPLEWQVGQSLTIGQIRIETRCDHKANEDRLFFTKEEAQSECDKRNSQPKEKGE